MDKSTKDKSTKEKTSKQYGFNLNIKMMERFKEVADLDRRSMTTMIEILIEKAIKQSEQDQTNDPKL